MFAVDRIRMVITFHDRDRTCMISLFHDCNRMVVRFHIAHYRDLLIS